MPLRGDFSVEYDNDAELILADMEFCDDDKKSDVDLKYEVLKLYNAKLDERIRRKKFVIDKGLVDVKSILQQEQRLQKDEREAYSLLRPFQRFCSGDEYKRLAEGLLQEVYLRQRLEELQHFKSLGLNTFADIEKYLEGKREADASILAQKGKGDQSPSHDEVANSSKKEADSAAKQENESMDVEDGSKNGSEAEESKALKSGVDESCDKSRSKAPEDRKDESARDEDGKSSVQEPPTDKEREAEFEGLEEEEKALCRDKGLPPKAYKVFKEKLQEKAKKARNALRRVAAQEFVDKFINKSKAMMIFDFLTAHKMLAKSE